MVCEDEDMVRDIVCETLRRAGYAVIETRNGQGAKETHSGMIDLLISDIVMPGMNGRELAEDLLSSHPEMCVLFISGYAADRLDDRGLRDQAAKFLAKPFGPAGGGSHAFAGSDYSAQLAGGLINSLNMMM